MRMRLLFTAAFLLTVWGINAQICDDNAKNLQNCGWLNMTEQDCHNYNCCWAQSRLGPNCYHKIFKPAIYKVSSKETTSNGYTLVLTTKDIIPAKYGIAITPLQVDIYMETADRLRVKIYDPNNHRWEIPTRIVPAPNPPTNKPVYLNYNIETSELNEVFWFAVERATSGEVIFNSSVGNSLLFYDQYIEVGSQLPKAFNLYGLGKNMYFVSS
ncbi:Alpha-glucosidase [Oopsacas minuta]|uniref:Alpha-glucosidase n=1 Tax=Oopsacas minuta TaxID=111878 RepID=A0AAV7K635_9METZ|nr:Alpha-glucosidase [Oopsacas minuta]